MKSPESRTLLSFPASSWTTCIQHIAYSRYIHVEPWQYPFITLSALAAKDVLIGRTCVYMYAYRRINGKVKQHRQHRHSGYMCVYCADREMGIKGMLISSQLARCAGALYDVIGERLQCCEQCFQLAKTRVRKTMGCFLWVSRELCPCSLFSHHLWSLNCGDCECVGSGLRIPSANCKVDDN